MLDSAREKPMAPQAGDPHPLRIVDSITELGPDDQGCIAISGSHGGLSSARYALAARPWLTVFNDAGVGKDAAGIAGLEGLQQQGLAACTVSHASACIGQARSTWRDGVLSHTNAAAHALGLRAGRRLAAEVCRIHPPAISARSPEVEADQADQRLGAEVSKRDKGPGRGPR